MNTIDTRELYTRKCELEELRDAVTAAKEELYEAIHARSICDPDEPGEQTQEELDEAVTDAKRNLESAQEAFGDDEQAEMAELEELESEIGFLKNGKTMIHERDFEEYAQELAEDIGAVGKDLPWPCTHIDWEAAAKELAMDYTTVTYQGTDYYVRA